MRIYTHELLLVFGSGSLKPTDYAVNAFGKKNRVKSECSAKVETSRLNLTEGDVSRMRHSMPDIPCWSSYSIHSESSKCCRSWLAKKIWNLLHFFSLHETFMFLSTMDYLNASRTMPNLLDVRWLCCLLPAAVGRGSRWYAANATRRVDCLTFGGFEGTRGGILGRLARWLKRRGKKGWETQWAMMHVTVSWIMYNDM